MTVLETIVVAFSMFSAVPMPQIMWNEKNMRYAMCAFPLIGALIGGVLWLWVWLCGLLGLPDVLRGAGLCLLPMAITGGIHLDGYADTQDALNSHQTPEKKLEILKDPHMGAFAAIKLCMYFVLSFALWTSLKEYPALPILLTLCLSRSLSGLAIATFPLSKNTGLAHTFATAADKKRVRVILATLSGLLCVGLCLFGARGAVMAVAALLVFVNYRHMAMKQFGGLSGDLAGWFLQKAELWMLIALCAWEYLEVLL